MLTSLTMIFLLGIILAWFFQRLRLPGLPGTLITGIILEPYVLNLLDNSILSILEAAIGSIPLAMGLACDQIVLTVAVLAIMITAPLGAFGIEMASHPECFAKQPGKDFTRTRKFSTEDVR